MPIIDRLKAAYSLWLLVYNLIPKPHKHSFGLKVDTLLIEILESTSAAIFLTKENKLSFIKLAIRKLDAVKILLLVGWENKFIDTKKYAELSLKLDVVGKMLGGWNGKLEKENSPNQKVREK